jgi:alcohol dehydrogenase class IV
MDTTAFSFASAKSIVFGRGKIKEVPSLIESLGGSAAFLLTDGRPGGADALTRALDKAGVPYTIFAVEKEPSTELVSQCVKAAKAAGCDLVIGMGGGSVLDTGKVRAERILSLILTCTSPSTSKLTQGRLRTDDERRRST